MARLTALGAGMAGGTAASAVSAWARGERADLATHAFSPANARRFAEELSRLRGAALKLGQLVSMDIGAVAPPEFAAAAERLRADADPMPPGQLRRVLDRRWGKGWMARFQRFEPRPAAAASIGQVHKAVTKEGRVLAVKIQYPGVRASIDSDLDSVGRLARLTGAVRADFDLAPYLDAAKTALHHEADYEREADSLRRYKTALGDDPDFVVPGVDANLSGPDILALDWLEGRGIERAAQESASERMRVFTALLTLTLRELFAMGLMQSDPNYANFLYAGDGCPVGLIDFGAVIDIDPEMTKACRAVLAAGLAGDDDAMATALGDLGALKPDTAPAHRDALVALADQLFSAVRASGEKRGFDFTDTGRLTALREGGVALQRDGFAPEPAPQLLFIQRKFAGLYLLGAALNIRMDVREILKAWV
ncbi:MAG: AarF/ABC1/UbiB kinase family protein [Oceanicaulis sp.]